MSVTSLHHSCAAAVVALFIAAGAASAQDAKGTFTPTEGQAGKDVVWVPTPENMVERMLDVAKVTAKDYVMDLGSGDGRNIIAAAKRGARARGVEFNPDMVSLSKRRATEAGVGTKAEFIEGDMYAADISEASVLAIFLLPHNMEKLRDKFLALKPGSRIVSNTFAIPEWEADYTETMPACTTSWCSILLYIVPARVDGTWQTPQGAMTLTQEFQKFSGSVGTTPVAEGTLDGEKITFTIGGNTVTGVVNGNTIEGTVTANGKASPWRATKAAAR